MSESIDLLLTNGTVVTMDAGGNVFLDGAVAIRGRAIISQPGPYLEVKSRTWSSKDADAKAALIDELMALFGVDERALVKQEYVEL